MGSTVVDGSNQAIDTGLPLSIDEYRSGQATNSTKKALQFCVYDNHLSDIPLDLTQGI